MSFDIDAYRRTVTPVVWDDIDFGAFKTRPLSEEGLRCLRYMHDVESHTVCYLRDLLLTASHKDPRITTFLTMWNYEEYWHGVAIGAVLEAHGEVFGDDRIGPMRIRQGIKDKLSPITSYVGGLLLGEDFIALHMTWGAVNEWSTQTGYERLIEREDHPELTKLLKRIAKQESRHIAFYATEARERLAKSSRARRATRWALKTRWNPVGSGVMPLAETDFLLSYLMGGTTGENYADRIDSHVDKLPGLDGLNLVQNALDKILARAEASGTAVVTREPVAV